MKKLTTDEWAKKHPLFFKNVNISFQMLIQDWMKADTGADVGNMKNNIDDFMRHIAIFARQEFDLDGD